MRETLIFQGILTLVGIAFVAAGIGDLSTSVPLGVLSTVGGLLIIAGAVIVVVRKKGNERTTVIRTTKGWQRRPR